MAKNIIVCCDGTGAEYGRYEENTNVVRLFAVLRPDSDEQISYYDPGVGTYSPMGNPLTNWLEKHLMMASGRGVTRNVQKAYKYLMDYYEPGDKIFLFGFSRGAHTVRELGSLIERCGLLTKGSDNLIPYAVRLWEKDDPVRCSGFRAAFSRESCKPHFIGVWDAVAAVGWLAWRRYYKHRQPSPDIPFAYHAVSVDENRWYFQVSDWDEGKAREGQTIEQMWFPGSHSDVGGYDAKRGISNLSLVWMLENAESQGLLLKDRWRNELPENVEDDIRASRKHIWRLVPAKKRVIPANAKIHPSVEQRIRYRNDYHPTNLPAPPEETEKTEEPVRS